MQSEILQKTSQQNKSLEKVEIGGEHFFKISDVDSLRPFMMSVVSNSNHWMFLMSNGGITAGRKNSEQALFPYYTDDKLAELAEFTGSKTIIRLNNKDVWEPFSVRFSDKYKITRNLFKNFYGNKVIFEEINHSYNLSFRYEWNSSDEFGFIKKSILINNSENKLEIRLLDGLQNIMPYGVSSALQNASSNLVDAYKRNELHEASGIGIYSLSANIVDRAEPSESLKANIVWSNGLDVKNHLLSTNQLNKFRRGDLLTTELDVKGEKGAYFIESYFDLNQGNTKEWQIIANVNQDQVRVYALINFLKSHENINEQLQIDIDKGTEDLIKTIASADGLQFTGDYLNNARHFSNVLFNVMRGGIFNNNYEIDKQDFIEYLQKANSGLVKEKIAFLNQLNSQFTKSELDKALEKSENKDLIRLSKEYLPLRFSRRHGDPSRPWNKFNINTRDEITGKQVLDYEGNWRDIFQNWEALAYSYPDFVEGMIFKFLNASTFEGYNPYRVNKDGFDWEIIEHDNPWSYIGYWGDHQVIYLLKFLEFARKSNPELMNQLFTSDSFVYAHVPYKIKTYSEIVQDPKNTIEFDEKSDEEIRDNIAKYGSDEALLKNKNGELYYVNFIEKILALSLSKLSNFVPDGGIWMNTQRPEWNDANNALVGNGLSMVTLCYLYRFMQFLKETLGEENTKLLQISEELNIYFEETLQILRMYAHLCEKGFTDVQRKTISDSLGSAGSNYRTRIYSEGFKGEKCILNSSDLFELIDLSLYYFEHSIRKNRRADGLYHSYNLLTIEENSFEISYLNEMLEGQVAILSSGLLNNEEAAELLDVLEKSALYRSDQNSYLLYPDKNLPGFFEKNNIEPSLAEKSLLIKSLVQKNEYSVVIKDINGNYHFSGSFHHVTDLKEALDKLDRDTYGDLVAKEQDFIKDIFELTFRHKEFTGRSGTFFAYEGLGSIYWHMVSKLHLAISEICVKSLHEGLNHAHTESLLRHFKNTAQGIGVHKSPELYGAFPTDAYSHTPMHKGAQQPGMTGQVKEDILVRIAELGIRIIDGELHFDLGLLGKKDFIESETLAQFVDVHGNLLGIRIQARDLAFTYCQIPVCYSPGEASFIEINYSDSRKEIINGLKLNKTISKKIFSRNGEIAALRIEFDKEILNNE